MFFNKHKLLWTCDAKSQGFPDCQKNDQWVWIPYMYPILMGHIGWSSYGKIMTYIVPDESLSLKSLCVFQLPACIGYEGIYGVMPHYWIAGRSKYMYGVHQKQVKLQSKWHGNGRRHVKTSYSAFKTSKKIRTSIEIRGYLLIPKISEISEIGSDRILSYPPEDPNTTVVSKGPINTVHWIGTDG